MENEITTIDFIPFGMFIFGLFVGMIIALGGCAYVFFTLNNDKNDKTESPD